MRKKYTKPVMESEEFVASEYVASCSNPNGNWTFTKCNADHTHCTIENITTADLSEITPLYKTQDSTEIINSIDYLINKPTIYHKHDTNGNIKPTIYSYNQPNAS